MRREDPCMGCRPPTRYSGCKSQCEKGQASLAYWEEKKKTRERIAEERSIGAEAVLFKDDRITRLLRKKGENK